MYHLKRLLLLGVLLYVNLNVSAQALSPRFGVKAGYNLSYATVDDASATNSKAGYHVGGTFEYSLSEKFLIQSGLVFSTKGSRIQNLNKSDYIPSPPDDTHKFNQSYLILPLYGAYKLNITKDFSIIAGVGPYVGYGIGGKTKQKLSRDSWGDGTTETEWETFEDGVFDESRSWLRGTTLKRFDTGVGGTIDFEYYKFVLCIGYERGLRNIAVENYNNDLEYKNNTFQASVGYKF